MPEPLIFLQVYQNTPSKIVCKMILDIRVTTYTKITVKTLKTKI